MADAPPLPRPIHMIEFAPLLGKTLLADCDPRAVSLELVEVKPLPNHARLERPPFSLMFRSGPEAVLVTGTYALHGNGFGPDLVHIAQIAAPATGTPGHYYQAIFN